jgi:hypothetical protein
VEWSEVGWGGVCPFKENVNFYLLKNFNFENILGTSLDFHRSEEKF